MKTTINYIIKKAILITVIVLGYGISSVWAASPLAPSTPSEATFEYSDCGNPPCEEYSILFPTTPAEADFDEDLSGIGISLLPGTPAEADFNDNDQPIVNWSILNPVTPKEADFTEEI